MRLIDGDALKQEFEDLAAIQWNKDTCTTCARAFKESAERVEDAKTVDAVQVVRCKDCKNWDTTWQNDWAKNYHYCPLIDGTRNGDWYCADGERKSE